MTALTGGAVRGAREAFRAPHAESREAPRDPGEAFLMPLLLRERRRYMHNPAIPLLRLIERLIGRLLSREAVWQCGSEAVWLLSREAVWRLIQSDPVPLWLRGDDAISLILSDIIRF